MWWDERFRIAEHGDPYEREWWHLISEDLPAYGVSWQRHIVPFATRLDPEASTIMVRDDLPDQLEQFAMAHYSVFYYLARATLLKTERN